MEEDLDGVKCYLIALSFEASGEYEPPQREWGGGRGGRGGRALEFEAGASLVGVSYEAELEGNLWFAIEEGRPAQLELEGEAVPRQRNREVLRLCERGVGPLSGADGRAG